MKNRAVEQSPIVRSRKISPPVRKATPSPAKSEGYHSKCLSTPVAEKLRIPTAQSKTPTVTSSIKNPLEKKVDQPQPKPTIPSRPASTKVEKPQSKTSAAACKKTSSKKVLNPPKQQQPQHPPSLEVSLSREEVRKLTSKFQEVSSSVVQVATSRKPVGAKSLEAFLNLEISNALGSELNEPVFAQGFVLATRRLLEELVRLYEAGKLNPKLLREEEKKKRLYIRANSSTTVCYRDRYFKELVMNVLQTMTSSEIEEEVAEKATHSEESKERIRIIRDMVRTEAGLEPEDYRALEQTLKELSRSLSKNRIEMEKAALEVDRIISQHRVREEQSTSNLQIPKTAKEIWKASCKRLESGSDVGAGQNENNCCEQTSCSRNVVGDGSEQYKKSLNVVGEKECFEKGNSDEIQTIRPHLKHLVHEELLKIKTKGEEILKSYREINRNNRLGDTPRSSVESVDFKSAASNLSGDEDDGENNEEETRSFLEALRAEIEERNITNEDLQSGAPQGVIIRVLEKIDEDEDEMNYKDVLEKTDSRTTTESKLSSSSLSTSDLKPPKVQLTVVDGELQDCDKETFTAAKQPSIGNLEIQSSEKSLVERIKSKWFYQETSDVKNVLAEMKDAFETFKVMSDVFSAYKISKDGKNKIGNVDKDSEFNKDINFNLWDFTVGEVANVLVNISDKISNLSKYLQETPSNDITEQKKEALKILSDLEIFMNVSNSVQGYTSGETSLCIEKIATTFSFLSSTLNCSPREIKSESISALNPPKSLIHSLHTLSSIEYFRDCFISLKYNQSKTTENTKYVEVVKPYSINENKSSGEMLNIDLANLQNPSDTRKKTDSYSRDMKRPDDVDNNLQKIEHYMGLSPSVMTIQNVSDMFLLLSSVLNDAPERIKSEKILDLDPPESILKALDILYCDSDIGSVTEIEKKKSFASLTIQNVSDFLLTLSKTFDDYPERLKGSIVADLEPPESLLRAITLMTSISHLSISECCSQETVEGISEKNLSDEKFFDAVTSLGSMS